MSTALRGGEIGQDVKTWTFDDPCENMEWTDFTGERIPLSRIEELSVDDADVVVIGIQGPPKSDDDDDDDDDDNEEDEEKEVEPMELSGPAKSLDDRFGGILADVLRENGKTFKNGAALGTTTPVVRVVSDGKIHKIVLMGLGPAKGADDKKDDGKPNLSGQKLGTALAAALIGEKGAKTATLAMPASYETDYGDFASSFYSKLYSDIRFKGLKANMKLPAEDLTSVKIFVEGGDASVDAQLTAGTILAKGLFTTKDIVNAPHNALNSLGLANTARRIAEESGGTITCEILDKEECQKRNMGAFLAVARGSETDPYLIHLTYKPKSGSINKKVGLVGKGLLFDTGGYNIKTAMMEAMKFDCGGSAAVLGAARAVGELEPEGVEAHFVVAACENMINAKAYVPSDILTASNGKTIEVMNTDAEGRLTMADALVYIDKELECEKIIEMSTLTGACMISLGQKVSGVWTANDDLAKELDECSKATGDQAWRMPLVEEYRDQMKSKFADMKNIGTRYGGAITAALFLTNFVDKKKPFAHIDIAGPVWSEEIGATGYGCRLAAEWIKRQGKAE